MKGIHKWQFWWIAYWIRTKVVQKTTHRSFTDNTVERLEVSLIKWSFDNWMYVSNPWNENFYYLPFNCDERLITRRQIYHVNYDIIEKAEQGFNHLGLW